jgi:hypothetical protein
VPVQIHGSGAWIAIIIPVAVSETTVSYNSVSSSAATYVVENCVDLSFVLSYRYQFVAALEDAK